MGTDESGEFEPHPGYYETEMQGWEDAATEHSFEYLSPVEQVCIIVDPVPSSMSYGLKGIRHNMTGFRHIFIIFILCEFL